MGGRTSVFRSDLAPVGLYEVRLRESSCNPPVWRLALAQVVWLGWARCRSSSSHGAPSHTLHGVADNVRFCPRQAVQNARRDQYDDSIQSRDRITARLAALLPCFILVNATTLGIAERGCVTGDRGSVSPHHFGTPAIPTALCCITPRLYLRHVVCVRHGKVEGAAWA